MYERHLIWCDCFVRINLVLPSRSNFHYNIPLKSYIFPTIGVKLNFYESIVESRSSKLHVRCWYFHMSFHCGQVGWHYVVHRRAAKAWVRLILSVTSKRNFLLTNVSDKLLRGASFFFVLIHCSSYCPLLSLVVVNGRWHQRHALIQVQDEKLKSMRGQILVAWTNSQKLSQSPFNLARIQSLLILLMKGRMTWSLVF